MRCIPSCVLLTALTLTCTSLSAALTPQQVGIVAMAESPDSIAVAEHYAAARGIPPERILRLTGTPQQVISRADWEQKYAPQIRRWLEEQGPQADIRCLATVWDVPLKIGPRELSTEQLAAYEKALAELRAREVARLSILLTKLDQVAPGDPPLDRKPLGQETPLKDLATAFETTLQQTQRRIAVIQGQPEAAAATERVQRVIIEGIGLARVLQNLQQTLQSTPDNAVLARQVERLRAQLEGLNEGRATLQQLPETIARDVQFALVVEKGEGLLGAISWIDQYVPLLRGQETFSSFDSELSLVLWPEHSLIRWMPNLKHHSFDTGLSREQLPVLMVSRLEAPTVELTKQLIDTTIEVEKTGLGGKFYIDARGIAFDPATGGRGSYGDYDEALRHLADLMKKFGSPETILDDKPELFAEATCPDAGLYCGWYSLSNYIDSFTWTKGAVAYHIASGEAATLRDPDSNVWCKRMLEKGVCATVGPVYEPYLMAFPRPDEFFPLLMTGKLTLVETYYRTLPFNSWVMVLVGDPLYNPFQAAPALTEEGLPPELLRILNVPADER